MKLDRLTIKAQEALQAAQETAQRHSHQEIDAEHLCLALVPQPEGLIQPLLEKLGVPISVLTGDLEKELARRPKVQGGGEAYLGNKMKKVIDAAEKEAGKLKDDYTSTEHLLLGLIEEASPTLKKIFSTHGIKRDAVFQALAAVRGHHRVTDQNPEDKFQALEKYGRDLTALARAN